ncbi:MAG: hypothetical protein ACRD2Z_06880 [Thermoanaerobaculia bacterium]
MEAIKKRYIVDEENRRVAVQIDLDTYERLEELLEDHALTQLMAEGDDGEALDLEDARSYYDQLPKAD